MPVTFSGKLHKTDAQTPHANATSEPVASGRKTRRIARLFLLIILGAFFAGMIIAALSLWAATGFDGVGAHGFALYALIIGGGFTMALTAGLMAAVFYSDRAGFDDDAYHPDRTPPRDDAD